MVGYVFIEVIEYTGRDTCAPRWAADTYKGRCAWKGFWIGSMYTECYGPQIPLRKNADGTITLLPYDAEAGARAAREHELRVFAETLSEYWPPRYDSTS